MNEDRPLWLQAIALAFIDRDVLYLPVMPLHIQIGRGATYHEANLPPHLRNVCNDEEERLPEFEEWAGQEVSSLCRNDRGEQYEILHWSWHHFPSGGLEVAVWR